MITPDEAKSSEPRPLDHTLASATVINWRDLVRGAVPGLVRVECHVGEERLIDDVRIWSSTARGYWSLVYRCSIDPDLSCTLHFRNGYQDGDFGDLLSAIMKRQSEFLHKRIANANYLVQVGPPTVDVLASAKTGIDPIAGS
jgi:hypothetical protein